MLSSSSRLLESPSVTKFFIQNQSGPSLRVFGKHQFRPTTKTNVVVSLVRCQTPVFLHHLTQVQNTTYSLCRLMFSWWGCYGLCPRYKQTQLAHSFLFCSCVCFCLYGPFNCISFHKFSQQLSAFSLCSSGLISAFQLYISIWKSPSALM